MDQTDVKIAAILDKYGREVLDSTPMQPPVGYQRTKSLAEQIRDMVRSEALRQAAEAAGFESFEESDDFDVGDDYEPSSPYEEHFDPVPVSELRRRAEEAQKEAPSPNASTSSEPKNKPVAATSGDPGIGSASDDQSGS